MDVLTCKFNIQGYSFPYVCRLKGEKLAIEPTGYTEVLSLPWGRETLDKVFVEV